MEEKSSAYNSPYLAVLSPTCGVVETYLKFFLYYRKPPPPEDSGVGLSVVAGFSAALSSVFGKLAFDSSILPRWLETLLPWLVTSLQEEHQEYLLLALRGVCFVMIFLTNVIMINLFVKSMNLSTASEAVVVNTACNFFFTVRLESLAQV